MKTVAFFGMGHMGLPIALNLLKAGIGVRTVAYDPQEPGPKILQENGGQVMDTYAGAVDGVDAVFSIIPNDAAVLELYGREDLQSRMPKDCLVVEMTSCSAGAVKQVEHMYQGKIKMLDAPVTGGVAAATAGTITFMCAGSDEAFNLAEPYLNIIGSKLKRVGENVGDGKMVKIINNLFYATHTIIIGEAIKMIKANHLNPDAVYNTILESSGCSTQFKQNFKTIYDEEFSTRFALKLMRKDIGLATSVADKLPEPLLMTKLVYDIYMKAIPYDEEDAMAVYKVL